MDCLCWTFGRGGRVYDTVHHPGTDLLAVERFRDDTRHMIEFEVLKDDNLIALRGETARLFLNERGYQRARQSRSWAKSISSVTRW